MSAALVRHVRHRIFPGGGPFGYLDTLRQALTLVDGPRDVRIVVEEHPELVGAERPRGALSRLLSRAGYKLRRSYRSAAELRLRADLSRDREAFAAVDAAVAAKLFECDLLFVHDILLAERLVRVSPGEARRKAVLLTHAPSFYAEQWIAGLAPELDLEASRRLPLVREEIARELDVMGSVRAVAWPMPEAREGYPEWLEAAGDSPALWITSGVLRPSPSASRGETRQRWGVAEADRVVLFMGRPHPHKGFDHFAECASAARRARSRLVFVAAGSEVRWPGLDVSGILAVGYEADPAAAYEAADLVVFPNRKAYLDFGLMQCLALGVPMAVSPVGGHAALLRDCPAIPAIRPVTAEDVVAQFQLLAEGGVAADYRERATELWQQRFSPQPFVAAHAAASRKLLDATHTP
jgi:glycosyltransferase involved in cell wall biosynthesis